MSKTITEETNVLEAKTVSKNFSIQSFKKEIFSEMTALEMVVVLNKMQEDLLCSQITDEDTHYRNEIVVLSRNLTKMILGIHKELQPNKIHVFELIC
jgi:uncharacterized protein (DUF1015 family)